MSDAEMEDWEDYETIDEARNEIKRLSEEVERLRDLIASWYRKRNWKDE